MEPNGRFSKIVVITILLCVLACSAVMPQPLQAQAVCDPAFPTGSSQNCSGVTAQCSQNLGRATCDPGDAQLSLGPQVCGIWTSPVPICTAQSGGKCSGVHAALLSTGNVLFWYKTNQPLNPPSSFVLSNELLPHCTDASPDCVLNEVSPSFGYDILCAGIDWDLDRS